MKNILINLLNSSFYRKYKHKISKSIQQKLCKLACRHSLMDRTDTGHCHTDPKTKLFVRTDCCIFCGGEVYVQTKNTNPGKDLCLSCKYSPCRWIKLDNDKVIRCSWYKKIRDK